LAMSCREISTLSSAMAFHIKLGGPISGKVLSSQHSAFSTQHSVADSGSDFQQNFLG
jgi:hypothetical protein